MSIEAALSGRTSASLLSTALESLTRRVRRRVNAHRLADDLGRLSDHYLRDVGLERPTVLETFERSALRDRLIELGWRYSQRV